MSRVLVVEDEEHLAQGLRFNLEAEGYSAEVVGDGETATERLLGKSENFDAVVLDIMLPGKDGFSVVSELRAARNYVPVLMLTARDAPADRVTGLDHGADDYLVKPFDFGELLARMRALQRRPRALQAPQLVVGDLRFDPATRDVRVGTRRPALTTTELGILEMLMRRSPAVVQRRVIALHVWEHEADAMGSNTIDVHLARLRSKLAGGMVRIETVRGVGYRMVGA